MKVLILACLIAAVSAVPRTFLGSEKCTWGPSYWCKTYKQATECNAIEHCKTHVWKSNEPCGECKSIVQQVHDYCKNNGSAVLEMMKNLCSKIPQYTEQCKMVVSLYGETILSTIVKLTADSSKFCQELGVCPKTKQEVMHRIMKVFVKHLIANPTIRNLKSLKEDYCEDCKLAIGEVKDLLENKDIQRDIITILENLCANFGAVSAECKSLVDQYAPTVFELLAGYLDPPSLCAEVGLCNSTINVVAAAPLQAAKIKSELLTAPRSVLVEAKKLQKAKSVKTVRDDVKCTLCEFVMKELDGILEDKATEEEIQKALDEVCSLLPATIRTACDDFVDEFGPMIIELLLQEIQPDQVCTALGLCGVKKNLVRVSLHKKLKVNDEKCDLCKLGIQYVESVLKTNKTEDEIKEALEAFCKRLLPSELSTECTKLVDKYSNDLVWLLTRVPPYAACKCNAIIKEYGDILIKLILAKLPPDQVCKEIGMCASGQSNYVKNKCYLGESYWCANYYNALKCENQIHQELLLVCLRLQSSLSSECFMVAHKFRKDKENEIKDGSLCQVLKFYKNTMSQEVPKGTAKNSSLCQDCKDAVKLIENLFPKNTSKEEILNALKAFCSRFVPDVSKECNDLINRYSDFIIKLLLGEIDPETFCEQLELCQPTKKAWTNLKCSLGKSFWCSSYQNALDCQALEHCALTV